MAIEKKSYYVTDVQGARPDIAGKRRNVGERIELTEDEARFELSRGAIETNETREARAAEKRSATPAAAAPKPPKR